MSIDVPPPDRPKSSRWEHFSDSLWEELGPIVRHAIVFLVTQFSVLIVGFVTHWLKQLFHDHEQQLNVVETIDIWLALAVLCLFALSTFIQVLGLVGRIIWESWLGRFLKFILRFWRPKKYGDKYTDSKSEDNDVDKSNDSNIQEKV